jgi:hypothetical protein
MVYNNLRVTDHQEGVDAQDFSENKTLVQGISFDLVIGCDSKAPMEGECLIS